MTISAQQIRARRRRVTRRSFLTTALAGGAAYVTLARDMSAFAQAGQPIKIAHGEPTVMAMLECYEPSLIAWRVLQRCADAFMTVGEQDAVDAMRMLANPKRGDRPIVAGESGGAGLAGLTRVCHDAGLREMLDLGPSSRVLLINTEGATDPVRYGSLVGKTPAEVLAA